MPWEMPQGGRWGKREKDSPRQTFPPNDPPHGTGEAYASVCVRAPIHIPPKSLSRPTLWPEPGRGLGHQFSRRFSFPLFRIPIYFPPNELRLGGKSAALAKERRRRMMLRSIPLPPIPPLGLSSPLLPLLSFFGRRERRKSYGDTSEVG